MRTRGGLQGGRSFLCGHGGGGISAGAEVVQGGRPCECGRLLGGGEWRGGLLARKALRPGFALGLKSRVRTALGHFKEMISRVLENLPVFRFPAHSRG